MLNSQLRRRVAALLEVLGVYLAADLVSNQLVRLFHISLSNPLGHLTADSTNAELISASRQMLTLLVFQYAGYFLIILPVTYWRRGVERFGLTKAGLSWKTLFFAGLGIAALCEWPVLSVTLLNSIHPSRTEPWRQALFDMSWKRWEFWLFSAVASWAVVPVLEELFFRGYCQRRLAEDWGDGAAIIGSACLFTFAHTQYQILNAYSIGMIVGLLISAIGFGLIFAWTRSLIPAIVAHAIINIPMKLPWQAMLLAAFVIGSFFAWRQGVAILRHFYLQVSVTACMVLAVISAGYSAAAARFEPLKYVAAGMLLFGVALEAFDRPKKNY